MGNFTSFLEFLRPIYSPESLTGSLVFRIILKKFCFELCDVEFDPRLANIHTDFLLYVPPFFLAFTNRQLDLKHIIRPLLIFDFLTLTVSWSCKENIQCRLHSMCPAVIPPLPLLIALFPCGCFHILSFSIKCAVKPVFQQS